MPFGNSILAGTELIREAIRSANYEAGTSGWSINRAGTAEFQDLIARGALIATSLKTAATGRRIEVNPEQYSARAILFFPNIGTAYGAIFMRDDTDVLTFAGLLSALSRTGIIRSGPALGALDYGVDGTVPMSTFTVSANSAVMSGAVSVIRADQRQSIGAGVRSNRFVWLDTSGNEMPGTILECRFNTITTIFPRIANPSQNSSLAFYANDLFAQTNTGANSRCHATAFVVESDVKAKKDISDYTPDPIPKLRKMKVKKWKYADDDHTPPDAEYFIDPTLENPLGTLVKKPVPKPPVREHIFPLSTDLPPEVLSTSPMSGNDEVDLRDLIGVLIAATQNIETRLTAIETK
jgi:hypothetical protein